MHGIRTGRGGRIAGDLFAQFDDIRNVDAVRQRYADNADEHNGEYDAEYDQCVYAKTFPAAHCLLLQRVNYMPNGGDETTTK